MNEKTLIGAIVLTLAVIGAFRVLGMLWRAIVASARALARPPEGPAHPSSVRAMEELARAMDDFTREAKRKR